VHSLTYTYSRPQLRQYFRNELWRTQRGVLVALPILLGAVIWMSRSQEDWWFAGFLAGIIFCYLLMVYTSYRRLDLFPVDQPMTLTFRESGIHFQSALVVSDVPWSSIRAVRRTVDGLVLNSRTTRRPVLVPAAVLTEEIVAFVQRQVRQEGPGAR
jgi:hypothetical protein